MDPIKVDFSGKGPSKKSIVIPPSKAGIKILINIIGTLIAAGIGYYFYLPAFNFKSIEMYLYIFGVLAAYCIMAFITSGAILTPEYSPYARKQATVPIIIAVVIGIVIGVGYLASSVFFRAKAYSEIIDVQTADFSNDIKEADFSSVPLLDSASAETLATKALSELADKGLVSQFTVYPSYTQINYKNRPVRMATLQYSNIIKWLYNRKNGLPGYLVIDMTTQKVDLVTSEKGMIYSNADHFNQLLKRHIRFNFPTALLGESVFEIDDNGGMFWICPVLDKTIGLFGGTDVIGAILVDPVTGECKKYSIDEIANSEELQWIDRVFDSNLLVEQYNYFGKYKGGFWNSILGQKEVYVTTEGYNYLALNDDVYMYTGITSITSDDSITGFTLINQRTKEAKFYRVAGAKEMAAEESAEGMVQQFEYASTFPLLLNIGNQPTYFMALKDKSNILQQYAMINVSQYTTLRATGKTITECLENYVALLKENDIQTDIDVEEVVDGQTPVDPDVQTPVEKDETVTGVIEDIRTAVIGGDSYYYFKLAGSGVYYSIKAADAQEVIITGAGANVTISFKKSDASIIPATSFELTAAQ